ncbi:aldolase [Luteitalea sp. TBR-22]|uniref:class II aldolase/adducin family protein n=1 Tax=Luteitalea sp. TBR-22 TaxID=2802971 RepID=UPI001AFAF729|nr:class II aldolase/adducin family protein [Luteitalea sp. TBR-22]BCS35638.1 aldolase [Luteitalea sp. TBR-22]
MVNLDQLRTLSARVGADPLLVQAAGGNTSQKDGDVLWIKASGTWLRDAASRDVFVPVDLPALRDALRQRDPAADACQPFVRADLNTSGLRPSIETSVHALMPQRVVVHVHCVNTIAWAIRADAEAALATRLDGFDWAFVPYARPGLPLADAIAPRLRPGVDVLVLGNHGLVVAADSVGAAEALLERVVGTLERPARELTLPDVDALEAMCEGTRYRLAVSDDTHALATDEHALAMGGAHVLYPDHVVFLGVGVATDLASDATLVAVPGGGVLVRDDAKPAAEAMGRCLADVLRRVEPGTALNQLDAAQIDQLINWDAEKYRQGLTSDV